VRVRQPHFDFADVDPVWASDPSLVHLVNAVGIVPAYVEPFLIKVMQRARPALDPVAHADLISDIDIFNRQEAQHFKFHQALNRWIRDGGYPGMADYESRYAAEYDDMLATKSLDWLLAYCEGFESMGLLVANAWVDGALEAALPDADPRPVALWRWHLAEEYEHRTVAHSVLKALYGGRPGRFYRLRLAGLYHASRHIGRTVKGLSAYLTRTYAREQGLPVSRRSARSIAGTAFGRPLRGMVGLLSPAYDPAMVPPPLRLHEALALAEVRGAAG
jgi:predicted metal-dependent hydrolase